MTDARAEHRAEIEQAIAQADDVSGYREQTFLEGLLVGLIGGGAGLLGAGVAEVTKTGKLGPGLQG